MPIRSKLLFPLSQNAIQANSSVPFRSDGRFLDL